MMLMMESKEFYVPLMSGGFAGLTADLVLFPLDTIKTRLQSRQGFQAAGGFNRVYAGLAPTAAGSAPSAALFFCTYELVKRSIGPSVPEHLAPFLHIFAATMGEVVSNILRVPFEVTKQRCQANTRLTPTQVLRETLQTEGPRGLFRGYFSTISREVPFSLLQYPLWEYLKSVWRRKQVGHLEPWQGAVCGAIAGGVAAGITTPLDVTKTRIMLAKVGDIETGVSIPRVLLIVGKETGISGLFAGVIPRICWMSVGGFIFLGAYDKAKQFLLTVL